MKTTVSRKPGPHKFSPLGLHLTRPVPFEWCSQIYGFCSQMLPFSFTICTFCVLVFSKRNGLSLIGENCTLLHKLINLHSTKVSFRQETAVWLYPCCSSHVEHNFYSLVSLVMLWDLSLGMLWEYAKLNIYSTFLDSKCSHIPPWMMWDPALSDHLVSIVVTFAVLINGLLGSSHNNKATRLCFGETLCLSIDLGNVSLHESRIPVQQQSGCDS